MCECMCEMFVAGTLVSLQTPHLSSNKGNIGKIQPTTHTPKASSKTLENEGKLLNNQRKSQKLNLVI